MPKPIKRPKATHCFQNASVNQEPSTSNANQTTTPIATLATRIRNVRIQNSLVGCTIPLRPRPNKKTFTHAATVVPKAIPTCPIGVKSNKLTTMFTTTVIPAITMGALVFSRAKYPGWSTLIITYPGSPNAKARSAKPDCIASSGVNAPR